MTPQEYGLVVPLARLPFQDLSIGVERDHERAT
jgi:hypothetical protein